mgnify:FL=1
MTWNEIMMAHKHGLGSGTLPAKSIIPDLPEWMDSSEKLLVLGMKVAYLKLVSASEIRLKSFGLSLNLILFIRMMERTGGKSRDDSKLMFALLRGLDSLDSV